MPVLRILLEKPTKTEIDIGIGNNFIDCDNRVDRETSWFYCLMRKEGRQQETEGLWPVRRLLLKVQMGYNLDWRGWSTPKEYRRWQKHWVEEYLSRLSSGDEPVVCAFTRDYVECWQVDELRKLVYRAELLASHDGLYIYELKPEQTTEEEPGLRAPKDTPEAVVMIEDYVVTRVHAIHRGRRITQRYNLEYAIAVADTPVTITILHPEKKPKNIFLGSGQKKILLITHWRVINKQRSLSYSL